MTAHPCHDAKCTKAQTEAFERIAINMPPFASLRTIEALIKKGLIRHVCDEVLGRDRFGAISAPVFEVPIPIHMQWCKWCSENVTLPEDDE